MRVPLSLLLAGGALLLTGCDRWALSIGGDGLLFVGVSGADHHRGRFRVRTQEADGSSRILDLPASGQLSLDGLAPGAVELTLLVPSGCRVAGPNPQTLILASDQAASAAFTVDCST